MRLLRVAAFLALLGLSVYGFWSRHLWRQELWLAPGGERFLIFLAIVCVWFGAFILFRPGLALPFTLGAVILYSIAAIGVVPLAATGFFLFSSFVLGRIMLPDSDGLVSDLLALLAGMCSLMWLTGMLAHFPVNYPATYVVILTVVVLVRPQTTWRCVRRVFTLFSPSRFSERRDSAMLAVALVPLLAHWLVVLKPEVGADALAMHLVVPAYVANHHLWSFDFRQFVWAVMPMGGDWCYTVTYLLGGEFAARLLNLGLLVVICAFVYGCALRWVNRPTALLLAGLFAATPVVQMVTGSLFVETFYAVMIAGALAALWQYDDARHKPSLVISAFLLASALSVKLGAFPFALPAAVFLGWQLVRLWRRGEKRWMVRSAILTLAVAPQPFLYAWWKTGNPLFPYFNNIFRSPYFDPVLIPDPRFSEPLTWRTLFDFTFDTHRYWEGQDGSAGFQLFLLVPLVLLAVRRDWRVVEWSLVAIAGSSTLLGLVLKPNLRYLYPAFPLLTLSIALVFREPAFRRIAWCAALACLAMNLWFLPSSSWYHKTFCLNPFDKNAAEEYLVANAPARLLVDRLNRDHSGENTLFLGTMDIAGLRGAAYSDGWHSHLFMKRVLALRTPADALRLVQELGLRHFIFPNPRLSVPIREAQLRRFVEEFTTPEADAGGFRLATLDAAGRGASEDLSPVPSGHYDDFDPRIRFFGNWSHDTQFESATNHSITYSDAAGASFEFAFRGSAITWVYTKALNRGIAEVFLDGKSRGEVDLYSATPVWQSSTVFGGLEPGEHRLEVRILEKKNPLSSGNYVDVDELVVQ